MNKFKTAPGSGNYLPWAIYGICMVVVYILCIVLIRPEMMHHIQHTGFYADRNFMDPFLHEPGGLLNLVTLYVTQFFHAKQVAAVCVSLLLTGQGVLLMLVLKKLSSGHGISLPLSLIPSVILLALLQDYRFQYAVIFSLVAVTACLLAVAALRNRPWVLPLTMVLGIALFHAAGSGYFTLFIVSSVAILLFRGNLKKILIEVPVLVVFGFLLPVYFSHYVYNLPAGERYTHLLANVPVLILYKPAALFYCMVWSLPVLIILAQIIAYVPGLKFLSDRLDGAPRKSIVAAAFALLILAAGIFLVFRTDRPADKALARISYEAVRGQWEEVARRCLQYEGYDLFVNFYYNLSCMQTGSLPERFFDYPQLIGEQAMFPDKVYSGETASICSDFYYNLGDASEARHWAYEAQTILPYSPAVLKQLVLTNLVCGNYDAARAYLSVLSRSPVEKKWAEKYAGYTEDTTRITGDPELSLKRQQMPLNRVNHVNMDEKYRQLIEKDSTNIMAWQCMMLYSMLGQRMGRVVKNYNAYGRISGGRIPEIYSEACLLYFIKMKQRDMGGLNIPLEVQKQFLGYNQVMKKYRGDKSRAKEELRPLFGNTYLYYITYYSPLVTNAAVTTREVDY